MPDFSANPSRINGSYVPRHFISDGDYAWFVEGFTSDTFASWRLRVAPVLPNGQPNMIEAQSPLSSTAIVLPNTDLRMLRLMIGNVQRQCQGMPTVRIQRMPA